MPVQADTWMRRTGAQETLSGHAGRLKPANQVGNFERVLRGCFQSTVSGRREPRREADFGELLSGLSLRVEDRVASLLCYCTEFKSNGKLAAHPTSGQAPLPYGD